MISYSERGQEYVDSLKSLIRSNGFNLADAAVPRVLEHVLERLARHELHGEPQPAVGLTRREDGHDVGMLDARGGGFDYLVLGDTAQSITGMSIVGAENSVGNAIASSNEFVCND